MDQSADRRVKAVLRVATQRLATCLRDAPAGSGETPYLDALVLLVHATGLTTEQLFAALDDQLEDTALERYQALVAERCDGIPVSYIRGVKEFYGREFTVGPGVLVPRPETELLVEQVLLLIDAWPASELHLHDCCTGSGCVATTVACERPHVTVTASDISDLALSYARTNARRLERQVEFWRGDLLQPLARAIRNGRVPEPRIIAANPPYLTDNEVTALTVRGWPEPAMALAAGNEGLDVIERLARQAVTCLADRGYLILEIGADQGAAVRGILVDAGLKSVTTERDLAGRDRVCKGQWSRP